MRNGWRECRLGDLFQIKHGYAFKGRYFGSEGSHIVLTPGNFYDEGGFKDKGDKEKWYSGEIPSDYVLSRGDLIVAMTEQAEGLLGSSAIIPKDGVYLHNQRLGLIGQVDGADTRFLYYLFNSESVRQQIRASCSGVKVRHTSPSRIYEVKTRIPDLPTQRRIAGILSAYDDLIENNLRRIRILEEMAQSLYREWFIHFRYPETEPSPPAPLPKGEGRKNGASPAGRGGGDGQRMLVDSPLGPIPQGWEVKRMPEAVEVRPKISVPKDDEIPFIPMGSLSEDSMLIGDVETRAIASGARFQNGDTVFARITPCLENGKTGFVQFLPDDDGICCGSTEFIVLRSKTVCPEYVYLMARSDPFRDNAIKSMSGATGRQRVRDECFEQFLLAQPPSALLSRFSAITQPQFQLIYSLNLRNQTLRRTRDLLLPKLLSPSN